MLKKRTKEELVSTVSVLPFEMCITQLCRRLYLIDNVLFLCL